ncbi:MAG: UDP-glucose 4-epimerase GalE [Bacteroidota bacterium]
MEKVVLVTGGLGYIGSHTAIELLLAGYKVVVVDNLSNSTRIVEERIKMVAKKEVVFYEIDCSDEEKMKGVFQKHDFFGIIHFAALKSVEESMSHPEKYYTNNVQSTKVLKKLCESFGVKKFVFSSSCTVYGSPQNNPVNEKTELQPAASVYGETKQLCEKLLLSESEIESTVVLRYFNPIGAHPSGLIGEESRVPPTNLVPILCEVALCKRGVFNVFGTDYSTEDGTCIRDYIHVSDLASAHVKALEKLGEKKTSIFNLGVGAGYSVKEVLRVFQEIIGREINVAYSPRRQGDIPSIWAQADLANTMLEWECKYGLKEALEHAWAWASNKDFKA